MIFLFFAIVEASLKNSTVAPGSHLLGVTFNPLTLEQGGNLFNIVLDPSCSFSFGSYTVPCSVNLVNIDETDDEVKTTVFTTTSDYSQTDDTIISGEAGGSYWIFKAHASFSSETQSIFRKSMSESKTYVQSRFTKTAYQLASNKINVTLSADFKVCVQYAVAAKESGNTVGYYYWMKYLVDNFPETYVSIVYVGASLVQDVFVDNSFLSTFSKTDVSNMIGETVSFLGFSEKGNYMHKYSQQQLDTLKKHFSNVKTKTVGGTYHDGDSKQAWETSADANPVAISTVLGDTVNFINSAQFPSLNSTVVAEIAEDYIKLQQYYKDSNIHYGCMMPNATNFVFGANVDDASCYYVNTNGSKFGGYYSSGSNSIYNPLLQNNTCPPFFYDYVDFSTPGLFFALCVDAQTIGPNFGGGFSPTEKNQITGDYSCPQGYSALPATRPIIFSPQTFVCVDATLSARNYAFGGGFVVNPTDNSCLLNNPFGGTCDCPSFAPFSFSMVISGDGFLFHLCYGGPVYQQLPAGQGFAIVPMPDPRTVLVQETTSFPSSTENTEESGGTGKEQETTSTDGGKETTKVEKDSKGLDHDIVILALFSTTICFATLSICLLVFLVCWIKRKTDNYAPLNSTLE